MTAQEGQACGFYNALHAADVIESQVANLARSLADGPWLAHGVTKTMMNQEWAMGIDEMIESEA
jgi:enoyl-CoA hydratase/carnithine racemase